MPGGSMRPVQYPIYKAVNDPELLKTARFHFKDALFIYRTWYSDTEQSIRAVEMQSVGLETAYNHWYSENAGNIQAMPWAYFESYNEMYKYADAYLAFEAYRARRLWKDHQVKSCVLNIGAGQTDKEFWGRARDMVQATFETGSIIGVHAYSEGVMSANNGGQWWNQDGNWAGGSPFPATVDPMQCHTGLRILQDKVHLKAQGQGAAVLVATELGLDDMTGGNSANGVFKPFGIQTRGWRSCWDVWTRMGWIGSNGKSAWDFYREQLQWWVTMTKCMGVVFTTGTGYDDKWDNFNVNGLI